MRTLLADLKFALRTLLKAPAFTTIAVLSLALGIGPNTAIFSLVSAVLFEDWGVEEPEGLIDIYTLTSEGQYFFSRLSSFELIEEGATDVFEAVAHHSIFSGRMDAPTGEAELVLGEMVTGNYFDVMGVQTALGRTFRVLSLVGLLALALACLGLYGMVSYRVARRTREMGIRLALGAGRATVSQMVLKSCLTLVGVGAAIGIGGSIVVGRAADRFLYGSGGLDPLALVAAPALLAAVPLLATYMPARRASRVDPVQALRTE